MLRGPDGSEWTGPTPFGDLDGTVVPGFVDLQVNGGFGWDFTSDPSTIWDVAAQLPRHGVTSFLPTVISSPLERAVSALEVLADGRPSKWGGARPLGLHVEGPMISRRRRGAHPADALVSPSVELAERLIMAGPPAMITVAPELAGAEEVVRRFVDAGTVVAVGHSDATAAQTKDAFGWGSRHATHLFNAMSGLDHRSPGVAAAVLADDTVTTGLIADGVHVSSPMLRVAWKALGSERICLVTDAMAATGLGDGRYRIGSVSVTVRGTVVRNAAGSLAGGAATMDHVFRTMAEATGYRLDEVVAMTSTTPTAVLGQDSDSGDLVLLDDQLTVVATAVGGTVVYRRDEK